MKLGSLAKCSVVFAWCLVLLPSALAEWKKVRKPVSVENTGSDNSYQQAKAIFPEGAQDYCFQGTYKAGKNDKWLALVSVGDKWELQKAVVTNSGKVEPQSGKAVWFLKDDNLPITAGAVVNSPITGLRTNNSRRSEVSFTFNGKNYRWVQWALAGKSFFLTDGASQWSSINWPGLESKILESIKIEIPEQFLKDMPDSDGFPDDGGSYAIAWAGDLNGDGLLDFIVDFQVKETWGHHLWIGKLSKNGKLQFELVAVAADGCS